MNRINDQNIPPALQVLLLEDDEIDYRAVCRALTGCDVDVINLLAGVTLPVCQKKYDIVLSDMNLPDSKGLSTISALISLIGKTPLVVLSGNEDDHIALEAVQAGAQDFISKKYISDKGLLNRTLRHAIERHQLKLALEDVRDRERFLAYYDQCTSLPNRLLFLDRLVQSILHAERHKDNLALMFVDLDRFKHVNDSAGHAAGDQVLRCVGQRMKSLIRDSDTVARFGGDEFVIILQKSDDQAAMQRLAGKIIDEIGKSISYGRHQCTVGASIGIACYPAHGITPEQLLKNADIAMVEAKNQGRNQYQCFNEALFEKRSRFFGLEKALREALAAPDNNFELHFQPRVEFSSNNVDSVEALIRWNHDTLGNIRPDQFIPLAEDLGLIEQIDAWVLDQACQKIVQWKSLDSDVKIGVNISGCSFNHSRFVVDVIEPILSKHNVCGRNLELEITEGVLLIDTQQTYERLQAIKNLGISLAIDDFGTGFSSLSYLNSFPIDTLKIDGSFICDHSSDKKDQCLLKAIISLGEALDMKVVAECIETDAQRDFLIKLSCNEGQGYLLGKPDRAWEPQKKSTQFYQKTSF